MSDVRQHLAIGEVLAQLQEEFPEVTISKIRFLESQGLINPERSPSGYRRFYEEDIERLRWVLHQQRDNFLPLKVIKSRLQKGTTDGPVQPALFAPSEPEVPPEKAETDLDPDDPPASAAVAESPPVSPDSRSETPTRSRPATASSSRDSAASDQPPAGGAPMEEVSDWLSKLQESPVAASSAAESPASASASASSSGGQSAPTDPVPDDAVLDSDTERIRYGRDELVAQSNVDSDTVDELVAYGLLIPRVVGGEDTFDAAALDIVRGVEGFLARGVEVRHLRMFKNAADREAGFYEQMILPLLKQRNPKARHQAIETLQQLMAAGAQLRRAQVRHALREHLD